MEASRCADIEQLDRDLDAIGRIRAHYADDPTLDDQPWDNAEWGAFVDSLTEE